MRQCKSLVLLSAALCSALFCGPLAGTAPAQEKNVQDVVELSLEDLMNTPIVTASKKAESVFDSPLSASVVTREEIRQAGATSIPEALRLIPGLIVRQQTNGNYDIHLRGLDNVPPFGTFLNSINTVTLTMIDGRPVYNQLRGGTQWDTLGIDLQDVERIEVVRGPSSALYGPNAVAGVINIITRRPEKQGPYAVANAFGGNYGTWTVNGAGGYKTDRLSVLFSANHQKRNRFQEDYYDYLTRRWVEPAALHNAQTGQLMANPQVRYPETDLALDCYGFNGFLDYQATEKVSLHLSTGYQEERSQRVFSETTYTPLSTSDCSSQYVDAKVSAYGLTGQFIYLGGEVDMLGNPGTQATWKRYDVNIEYEKKFGGLELRPGYSFRRAVVDDAKAVEMYGQGLFGGARVSIDSNAFSLRADYRTGKLRLVGAVRLDKHSVPDDYTLSYQAAAVYNVNEDNLIRFVAARASKSSFSVDSFLNYVQVMSSKLSLATYGNQDLELLTQDMVEVGYRSRLSAKAQLDMEAFYSRTKNYIELLPQGVVIDGTHVTNVFQYQNIPIQARQYGATASLNYIPDMQFRLKCYATLQRTRLVDYAPNSARQDVLIDMYHQATPTFYGGFFVNYNPSGLKRLNLNVNAYFYGSQVFQHQGYLAGKAPVTDSLDGKFIFNLKLNFELARGLSVYFNARNLVDAEAREFAFCDRIKGVYLAGISYQY